MKRWLWIIGMMALVVAGAFWAMKPQPVEVTAAVVGRAPLRVTVEEEGKTRLRDRFVVSSPLAGYVRRMKWKEGDMVRAGDVAAVLEPLRAQVLDVRTREQGEARLKAAEAALQVAQARLSTMEQQARAAQAEAGYWAQQLKREEPLTKSGDIPQERLAKTRSEATRTEAARRAAESAVETARAEIEQARAEVASARTALLEPSVGQQRGAGGELVTVRWPVSGRVLKLVKESEGVVGPGEALIELGNTRALEVEVEVLSVDAVKMAPGTAVELVRWGGEKPLEGRVRVVEPSGFTKISALGVEEQRVRVIADITSPEQEWQRLGHGYRVEAVFILWRGEQVLQVPASALFRTGEQWNVYVIDGGVAKKRAVTLGHRNGLAAEVVSGVKEGERVIPHPDESVVEGKAVVVKE
ncbi:MAG: HlyD family efflux transporter periplasmic adaptor subunit [Acidobacteria bacterium]|nr:HlyD family efflux transporter periplasmic adaptor subunit [Acidobacteriota bacterium]